MPIVDMSARECPTIIGFLIIFKNSISFKEKKKISYIFG